MLHHWLGDLPTDTQRRVERGKRILKHRTDPRSEQAPTQRWRERSQGLTLEQDRAADLGFWAQKGQNGTGHAALAGPGLADNSERASGVQRKTDVAHCGPRAGLSFPWSIRSVPPIRRAGSGM